MKIGFFKTSTHHWFFTKKKNTTSPRRTPRHGATPTKHVAARNAAMEASPHGTKLQATLWGKNVC